MATPVGLLVMMFIFDWRLGLISLIPAFIAFVLMGTLMMGPKMAEDMKQYQNALEKMSSEAVEYVRGIPVVKPLVRRYFLSSVSSLLLTNMKSGLLDTQRT